MGEGVGAEMARKDTKELRQRKKRKGKGGVFGRLVAERSEGKCDKPWQEDE
jgi:hypothetical protein